MITTRHPYISHGDKYDFRMGGGGGECDMWKCYMTDERHTQYDIRFAVLINSVSVSFMKLEHTIVPSNYLRRNWLYGDLSLL